MTTYQLELPEGVTPEPESPPVSHPSRIQLVPTADDAYRCACVGFDGEVRIVGRMNGYPVAYARIIGYHPPGRPQHWTPLPLADWVFVAKVFA